MRVARIVASVIALMIGGVSPQAAAPQSRAAETSRPGPTPDEIAKVRAALAEYRKVWATEFDAESRAIARQYGAPTPDDLDRMFRDWLAGLVPLMPELPAGVTGRLADTFRMMPNKTPASPAKPGQELPDFANGAAPEALQSLANAKEDLNNTRDQHAEAASCSPEAQSAKKALVEKLNAYRKALADMEAARADVEREKAAGTEVERWAKWGAIASGVKSTADAAMELFGASAGLLPPSLGPVQKGMEAVGAAYSLANNVLVAPLTEATPNAAAIVVGAPTSLLKLNALTLSDNAARPLNAIVAAGETLNKAIDTVSLNADSSIPEDRRIAETIGNTLQAQGTALTQLGGLMDADVVSKVPGAASALGAGSTALGTTISTSIKYDRELDKAFDQALAGRNERVQLDGLRDSTLTRINVKRVEFMEKIAALEAEIGRSSCVK